MSKTRRVLSDEERAERRRADRARPADQAIRLAEGKAANHSVHTLIHELAHALHAAQTDDDEQLDYAQEELVVVVGHVTYTVAGTLGLPVDGFAIPYLASWSEDTGLAVIERAVGLIDRLAKRIEDAAEISGRENNRPPGSVYAQ